MIHKFKKWLSGDITWEEEKELRKEAANDSMLADAVEGYENFPESDHIEKIHHLNKRIRQQAASQTSRTPFPLRAIAASLVILVAAGLFWMVNQNVLQSSSENIAYQAPTETRIAKEAIKSAPNQKPEEQQPPITALPAPPAPTSGRKTNDIIPPPKSPSPSVSPIKKQRATKPTIASSEQQEIITENTTTISTADEAIAAAAQRVENAPPPTAESPLPADEGIVQAFDEAPIETSESEEVRGEDLDQPTTSGVALSRQVQSSAYVKQSENVLASPAPLADRDLLQMYLQENLQYPEKAKLENVIGTLRLLYQLDSTSNIRSIEIIDSLGFGCEEEAIRLLRSTPIQFLSNEGDTISINFGQ